MDRHDLMKQVYQSNKDNKCYLDGDSIQWLEQTLTPPTTEEIIKDLRVHFKEKKLHITYNETAKRFCLWNDGNWHLEIEVGTTCRIWGINDLPLRLAHDITTLFMEEL